MFGGAYEKDENKGVFVMTLKTGGAESENR